MLRWTHRWILGWALLTLSTYSYSQQSKVDTLVGNLMGRTYKVENNPTSTYKWECDGCDIIAGQGSSKVKINWVPIKNLNFIQVTETSGSGCIGEPVKKMVYIRMGRKFLSDTSIIVCKNNPVLLDNGPNVFFENEDGSMVDQLVINPTGTIKIKMKYVEDGSFVDSSFCHINAIDAPLAKFQRNKAIANVKEKIKFTYKPNQSNSSWTWILNDSIEFQEIQNLEIEAKEIGENKMKLIAFNRLGCSDSSEVLFTVLKTAEVLPPDPIDPVLDTFDIVIKLPNAFTPNNDGINDVFKAYIINPENVKSFDLHIFDRWGKEVYATTNHLFEWNGIYNNLPIQDGTYAFVFSATDFSEKKHEDKGLLFVNR